MAEMLEAFGGYVGTYEIWPANRIPKRERYEIDDARNETPFLVQTGPAKFVKPKREAFGMAILRLRETKIPKFTKSPADFSDIEKSALAIASHVGMLGGRGGAEAKTDLGLLRCESLDRWVRLAEQIQAMFHHWKARKSFPKGVVRTIGSLNMLLLYHPMGVSLHLLPHDLYSALLYQASQMLAAGTKIQNCEYCHTPFLSGGEARGGGKRRRDARFCSDECRYNFHNEARKKL